MYVMNLLKFDFNFKSIHEMYYIYTIIGYGKKRNYVCADEP